MSYTRDASGHPMFEFSEQDRHASDVANFVAIASAGPARASADDIAARKAKTAAFQKRVSDAIASRAAEIRAMDDKRHAEALVAQQIATNRKATLSQVCRLLAETEPTLTLQSVERVHHPRRQ